jgi:hypothetical protein
VGIGTRVSTTRVSVSQCRASPPQRPREHGLSLTLQTHQEPILLLLWLCFPNADGFPARNGDWRGCATRTAFLAFSLNWIMRSSQPMGVVQLSSHVSSACAVTCDCTKMFALVGSMPAAMYVAAEDLVDSCGAGPCRVSEPANAVYKHLDERWPPTPPAWCTTAVTRNTIACGTFPEAAGAPVRFWDRARR